MHERRHLGRSGLAAPVVALVLGAVAAPGVVPVPVASAAAAPAAPSRPGPAPTPRPAVTARASFTGPSAPAYAADAPDPDVLASGGTYYAFTTGAPLGNYLQALTSTGPGSGWHPWTGGAGSSALPHPPGWETVDSQTSPGVFRIGGRWVMFYDASPAPYPEDSGHSCLSVATAATLSPPQFTDTSTGPLYCGTPGVGVLDPSPFVDPATGNPYLLWKSNDGGGSTAPSQIWIAQLSATGTAIVGSPTVLLTVDQAQLPWETTTDDPQMVFADGAYRLLFSGGDYQSTSYDEALTTCAGPLGPCAQPAGPLVSTYGSVYGPGGGTLFQAVDGSWWLDFAAWSAPCASYSRRCGAVRELYAAPVDLGNGLSVPCAPPAGGPEGYRMTASDGGIFDFGNLPFCGSTGEIALAQPVVGMADTRDGGGYWTVARDGGVFTFGDAHFYGSTGSLALNQPIVGMAATPDGRGYWLVAADGGIFSFGDAAFWGSTGGLHLNQPIVGMAATPDGRGYWLVAADGGIFGFGDTAFHGSTGDLALNRPVVGMAAAPGGGGYWLVASDGGVFTFGSARFLGSTGGLALNRPIVGMTATADGGGYRMVASDGGVFSFGDAAFAGSTGGLALNRPIVGMAA